MATVIQKTQAPSPSEGWFIRPPWVLAKEVLLDLIGLSPRVGPDSTGAPWTSHVCAEMREEAKWARIASIICLAGAPMGWVVRPFHVPRWKENRHLNTLSLVISAGITLGGLFLFWKGQKSAIELDWMIALHCRDSSLNERLHLVFPEPVASNVIPFPPRPKPGDVKHDEDPPPSAATSLPRDPVETMATHVSEAHDVASRNRLAEGDIRFLDAIRSHVTLPDGLLSGITSTATAVSACLLLGWVIVNNFHPAGAADDYLIGPLLAKIVP